MAVNMSHVLFSQPHHLHRYRYLHSSIDMEQLCTGVLSPHLHPLVSYSGHFLIPKSENPINAHTYTNQRCAELTPMKPTLDQQGYLFDDSTKLPRGSRRTEQWWPTGSCAFGFASFPPGLPPPFHLYSWPHISNNILAHNFCPWLCFYGQTIIGSVFKDTQLPHFPSQTSLILQPVITCYTHFAFSNISFISCPRSGFPWEPRILIPPIPSGTCSVKHPFSALYVQCLLFAWFYPVTTFSGLSST